MHGPVDAEISIPSWRSRVGDSGEFKVLPGNYFGKNLAVSRALQGLRSPISKGPILIAESSNPSGRSPVSLTPSLQLPNLEPVSNHVPRL